MAGKNYQTNYSELYHREIHDGSRKVKAMKTLSVLHDFLSGNLSGLDVLEVGCFTGEIGFSIAAHFKSYNAIDVDKNAVSTAENEKPSRLTNLHFNVMNAEMLGFSDDRFDIVICSHVYEHVPNSGKMMDEIFRVLKKNGICYFAAGNRFVFMEPHHRLPFLSIMPKVFANSYLKIAKGLFPYYETHMSVFSLRKLVAKFAVFDYTKKVIAQPEKFNATDMLRQGSAMQFSVYVFVTLFYWLSPTFIWILKK